MVDIDYLTKLIPILKASGLQSFSDGQLHLVFHVEQSTKTLGLGPINTQDHHIDVPINEASLPPDLRTDNINSYDTLLNWSGSPIEKEQSVPGVNDQPIYPQERLPADPP